ncbi:MAG: gas vesicle protein [Gemmatimonadota bacterium]|nr:gas vesicle protein [Gemmatimonadota bacterium]
MTVIEPGDEERLAFSELLDHVLDRGLVITGDVTISVADIDLIRVGLSVYLTGIEGLARRQSESAAHRFLPFGSGP